MTGTADAITVERIPVDRITVLNPRVRDKKVFRGIVDSIAKVGLKQPIKVSRVKGSDSEPAYNLVYGQGRLEAFISLGQREVPAIVVDVGERDSLVISLVENVARRRHHPVELLRDIGALKKRGYTDPEIAGKIGYSSEYVRDIRRLLDNGEERLLVAVESGQIPVSVAMDIAAADEENLQEVLTEAYEKGLLRGKHLIKAKRLVEARQQRGKAPLRSPPRRGQSRTSSGGLVRSLQQQADRQRLMIKRADLARSRLLFVVEAVQLLMAEENFVTLLRAEGVDTIPGPLAKLIAERQVG